MEVLNNDEIIVIRLELEIENTGHITNTYLVIDKNTMECTLIDPAFDADKIINEIKKYSEKLTRVLITHSHADHIAALADLVNGTDIKVYINKEDFNGLYDKTINQEDIVETEVKSVDKDAVISVKDGDKLELKGITFEFIHTPGHTKGSMVIYLKELDILFSGDTIFENTYGRTDLKSGSHDDMKKSLDKIFDKFKNPHVFPGHGNDFFLENSKRKIRLLFAYKG